MNVDPDLMRPVYDAYRTASGTLHPDEVQTIRERAGLSQVAFAAFLGMSPATINCYDNAMMEIL
jgi:DNA-binding transcriptional regulator YiaG